MLTNPSVDDIEKNVDNRHIAAILAAKRARDLLTGLLPITEEAEVNPVSQAAKEMAEGLITIKEEQ